MRHAYSARRSRSVEGDVDQLGPRFTMLEPISDHAKRECLDLGLGLGRSGAIRQDTGKLGHFCDPAPVILTFKLNLEPQAKPPRASLPQTAPRIHRHARLTLRISCEAVPPSVWPAGAQGGTSARHSGAALSFGSCIRLFGGPYGFPTRRP